MTDEAPDPKDAEIARLTLETQQLRHFISYLANVIPSGAPAFEDWLAGQG